MEKTDLMTLREIRMALVATNMRDVANATGLSYATVRNIKSGRNANPTLGTLRLLSDFLERGERA